METWLTRGVKNEICILISETYTLAACGLTVTAKDAGRFGVIAPTKALSL
jgi:hypothetical protein